MHDRSHGSLDVPNPLWGQNCAVEYTIHVARGTGPLVQLINLVNHAPLICVLDEPHDLLVLTYFLRSL